MKPAEEKLLRDNIRSLITFVKQKRLNEEKELRGIIRSLIDHEMKQLNEINTPDNDPTPNKSTGINVLEDLLKKITGEGINIRPYLNYLDAKYSQLYDY